MGSLGALLTQQWIAGLRQKTEDARAQQQAQREQQAQAFQQTLAVQKHASDLQSAAQKRELDFAHALGQAAQAAGTPTPELQGARSSQANDYALLGALEATGANKQQQTQQSQQMLAQFLQSQYQATNQQNLAKFNQEAQDKRQAVGLEGQRANIQLRDQLSDENAKVAYGREMTIWDKKNKDLEDRHNREYDRALKMGGAKAVITLAGKDQYAAQKALEGLSTVQGLYNPTFLSTTQKLVQQYGNDVAKLTEETAKLLTPAQARQYQDFVSTVFQAMQDYRLATTGMQASQQELESMFKNLISSGQSPEQFKGSLQSMMRRATQKYNTASTIQNQGGQLPGSFTPGGAVNEADEFENAGEP